MFTKTWWFMLGTYALLWGAIFDTVYFWGAIGMIALQVLQYGIEDKNFFSFTCQVRYFMAALILLAWWEPMNWLIWPILAGLTVRLVTDYCFLARLVSLLPWNNKGPVTGEFIRQRIFSKPVKGSIMKAV